MTVPAVLTAGEDSRELDCREIWEPMTLLPFLLYDLCQYRNSLEDPVPIP